MTSWDEINRVADMIRATPAARAAMMPEQLARKPAPVNKDPELLAQVNMLDERPRRRRFRDLLK